MIFGLDIHPRGLRIHRVDRARAFELQEVIALFG